jgi:hypothetical protein
MKKMFLLMGVGALCTCLSFAQDTSKSGQSPASSNDTMSGNSVQGCLAGSSGNYTLTQDGTGTTFKLMGSENQLKKHVGHEVSITGQMSGGMASGSASDQGQGQPSSASSEGNTIQVTDVKMVSKQCGSGTGTGSPQ